MCKLGLTLLVLVFCNLVFGQQGEYKRVKYNNPGLVVDLHVGLWAWPIPIDYDKDGDMDLLVSCPDVPYQGICFFENAEVECMLAGR